MNLLEIFNDKKVIITTDIVQQLGNSKELYSKFCYYTGTILDVDDKFIKLLEPENTIPKYINCNHILSIAELPE